jgi:hypothetical protein
VDDMRVVNPAEAEPLTFHRRGHWFEPITTHHLESPPLANTLPYESLSIRKLLEALLGPEGRRKLALREKTNPELFELYDDDLVLRLHNAKNLKDTRTLLGHFIDFLGQFPPSPELAKSFLARYADYNPHTLYRYTHMIKSFMQWYGEPLTDFRHGFGFLDN